MTSWGQGKPNWKNYNLAKVSTCWSALNCQRCSTPPRISQLVTYREASTSSMRATHQPCTISNTQLTTRQPYSSEMAPKRRHSICWPRPRSSTNYANRPRVTTYQSEVHNYHRKWPQPFSRLSLKNQWWARSKDFTSIKLPHQTIIPSDWQSTSSLIRKAQLNKNGRELNHAHSTKPRLSTNTRIRNHNNFHWKSDNRRYRPILFTARIHSLMTSRAQINSWYKLTVDRSHCNISKVRTKLFWRNKRPTRNSPLLCFWRHQLYSKWSNLVNWFCQGLIQLRGNLTFKPWKLLLNLKVLKCH